MKAQFGEEKKFKTCYGDPKDGNFSLDVDSIAGRVHWDHCREQFAVKFVESITGFYFSHPPNKSTDIAEFITKFEFVLGIESLNNRYPYSKFARTNKEKILWIEPSPFWLNCYMKRSLLTILLRCGCNYVAENDNFDDVLFNVNYKENAYIRDTKSATLRFMFGFNKFVGTTPAPGSYSSVLKHGWREEFLNLDDSSIRRRLVLPAGEKEEPIVVGLELLWA